VQAIEEKDGFIVVKVTVPKTEDRGVLYHEVNSLKHEYEARFKALEADKRTEIKRLQKEIKNSKVEAKKLNDKIFKIALTAVQPQPIQIENNKRETTMNDKNIRTTITDSTVHGSVVTAETIDNSRHQSFDGTANNANINFGDNATLTNTVQPLDNQDENHTSH
jgi:hypothetical protein